MKIVAIDFETADRGADSACAVGLAAVVDGRVSEIGYRLIRLPRSTFVFSYLHGIHWDHVRHEPTFREVWDDLSSLIADADYLAAHNAAFDRKVLQTCCELTGHPMPAAPFLCTVKLARAAWNIYPTKLPNVCEHLSVLLDHHHAGSDALACAQIVAAALAQGHSPDLALLGRRRQSRSRSMRQYRV